MTNSLPLLKLTNHYQNYDWGTRDAIPRLLNLPIPEGGVPLAELWVGAHPKLPSHVSNLDTSPALDQLIAENQTAILGKNASTLKGLPYLFKVLSAARALSIQVHPSKAQAVEGFARENQLGIDRNAGHRNYKDDNHKPELMFALTDFDAMAGFRDPSDMSNTLEKLQLDAFQPWIEKLRNDPINGNPINGNPINGDPVNRDPINGVSAIYQWLLYLEGEELKDIVHQVLEACQKLEGSPYNKVGLLHDLYGVDCGVLFPLILNQFTLKPGEAIFLGAGIPHAYMGGTGLEVMANSDNVLRGGLTSKHMDREELIKITNFDQTGSQVQTGKTTNGVTKFDIPCPDFQMELIDFSVAQEVFGGISQSAELIFTLEGKVQCQGESFVPGDAFLIPACCGEVSITGGGRCARVFTQIEAD